MGDHSTLQILLLPTVNQQHISMPTSVLTTKLTYRSLSAQRLYKHTVVLRLTFGVNPINSHIAAEAAVLFNLNVHYGTLFQSHEKDTHSIRQQCPVDLVKVINVWTNTSTSHTPSHHWAKLHMGNTLPLSLSEQKGVGYSTYPWTMTSSYPYPEHPHGVTNTHQKVSPCLFHQQPCLQ
jgi:hypothetical protein